MQITVLDAYTLNPGDLSWHALERLGACKIYDRTQAEQVVERCQDADMVLTNKVKLNKEQIEQLPKLEYIGVLATGYNVIDLKACREKGIVVSNAPDYSTPSVVQLTFALLLELSNHVGKTSEHAKSEKGWASQEDFHYTLKPIKELSGKTMGIVGFGNIGKKVAELANALGMKVLVHRKNTQEAAPEYINYATFNELLERSDVLSLHLPYTGENGDMINSQALQKMKKSALLINTARGQLINENALAEALNSGKIAGAGLDVLSQEPPAKDNPLLQAKNCIITPHQAWASFESRERLIDISVENVRAFMIGDPQNVVS